MSLVSIVRGKNPQEITVEALEMANADEHLSVDKSILIKPNFINARHPSTGITTDSRVVEGVVLYLKKHGFEDIIIGEGCGHSDTFRAFENAGIIDVAEKWGVSLVDLNKDEFITIELKNPLALKKVKVARTALESTIISVPKLKLHRMTGVTLSIKNMMGAMTPKGSMHRNLSRNIADLASIVKPSLAVVDGIIAGEGHETSGNPVEMNLVIAGADPVAVDSVGSAVMGVSPDTVKHLQYAGQLGLGTCDLQDIEVVGELIETVMIKFRRSLSSKVLSLLA
jgi:uncharacterized protein (DUF362 family)